MGNVLAPSFSRRLQASAEITVYLRLTMKSVRRTGCQLCIHIMGKLEQYLAVDRP
jgi:hypothetical protein